MRSGDNVNRPTVGFVGLGNMGEPMCAEYGFPMTVGSAVGSIWKEAVEEGYGPKDHTEIYAFLEEFLRGVTSPL